MKHLILTLAMLAVCLHTVEAQDKITIHVDARPLAELITAEQQKSLQTLNITGKLSEEDYAFIRNNSLPQLKALNLREADIETIPAKAFYNYDKDNYKECQITLPEELEYIGDSAFFEANVNLVLTGKFPKRGVNTTFREWEIVTITLTEDNEYCKLHTSGMSWPYNYNYILSLDGKVLYYANDAFEEIIPEGVEIIAERAYEGRVCSDILFPKSLKEIGDYAFSYIFLNWVEDGRDKADFKFSSEEPPTLGKEAFSHMRGVDEYGSGLPTLHIPETWKNPYIQQEEQWKIFKDVEYWTPPTANIDMALRPNKVTIHQTSSAILCMAPDAVKLEVYTMDAVKVGETLFANGTATVKVSKAPAMYLYIVTYRDGRRESGKVVVSK